MAFDLLRDPPPLPPPPRPPFDRLRANGSRSPGRPVPRTALLVNPFYPKDPCASAAKHVLTPSLALTSVAGATPPGWHVSFWDENLGQGAPPLDPLPQVVGITVHLTFAARAYALAAWFRAHGCLVVLGGLHAQSCPDEVAAHADVLATGDGTRTWPRILADLEAGQLARRYHAGFRGHADAPLPDRSILPRWGFLTTASLIATQGCTNRCDFCYLATGDERIPYERRPVATVAAELAATGAPYAVFIDNNLGASRTYLRDLCRALAPLQKIWSAAVTLDVTDDPALVRELALAGCTGVFIGFESLDDGNLQAAGKRTPRADDYARRVELLHRHGIQVNGSFVLGFDGDGPDVFERTARWIEEVRLESATLHILTPYPGTPLFARLEAEGRILHRDWSRYDTGHCVFRPRLLRPEELEAGRAWMYRRLYSLASIWRRRPRQASAVLPYLVMALLYKRANGLWRHLIRWRLTRAVWAPLVELSRRRHLRYRARLARTPAPSAHPTPRLPACSTAGGAAGSGAGAPRQRVEPLPPSRSALS
ncbi:MAG: B12-binding domain-containing radical SAM protein [Anaeromyxobacter sp.]